MPCGRQKPRWWPTPPTYSAHNANSESSSLPCEDAEAHFMTHISSCVQEAEDASTSRSWSNATTMLWLTPPAQPKTLAVEEAPAVLQAWLAVALRGRELHHQLYPWGGRHEHLCALWGSRGPGYELHLQFKMLAAREDPCLIWTLCVSSHLQRQLCLWYGQWESNSA